MFLNSFLYSLYDEAGAAYEIEKPMLIFIATKCFHLVVTKMKPSP